MNYLEQGLRGLKINRGYLQIFSLLLSGIVFLSFLSTSPNCYGALPPSDHIENIEGIWIESNTPSDNKVWRVREICSREERLKDVLVKGIYKTATEDEVGPGNHLSDENSTHYIKIISPPENSEDKDGQTVVIKGDLKPNEKPLTPINVSAEAKSRNQIMLNWGKNQEPDLNGYWIFRSKNDWFLSTGAPGNPTGSEYFVDSTASSHYLDNNEFENTTYYYRIIAVDNSKNHSYPSDFASTDFGGEKYSLFISIGSPDAGSISLNPSKDVYEKGAEVILTAKPASNYEFDHWSGDISGTSKTKTVKMNSDMTITAHFTKTGEGTTKNHENLPLTWIGGTIIIILIIIIVLIARK